MTLGINRFNSERGDKMHSMKSDSTNLERAKAMVGKLTRSGGLMDYGAENLHLLVRIVRELASGQPVSGETVEDLVRELGIEHDTAGRFLRSVTERDDADNIVGALGLSLNEHPYSFTVNGASMTAWCAQDTLFLPVMLGQVAEVVTNSPESGTPIELTVGPEGVTAVRPGGSVMSTILLDPDVIHMETPFDMQMHFCRNIHFFANQGEVATWALERPGIVSLTLDEAFELGGHLFPEAYAYANSIDNAA